MVYGQDCSQSPFHQLFDLVCAGDGWYYGLADTYIEVAHNLTLSGIRVSVFKSCERNAQSI